MMKLILCFHFFLVFFSSFKISNFDFNNNDDLLMPKIACYKNYTCPKLGAFCNSNLNCSFSRGDCCAIGNICVNSKCMVPTNKTVQIDCGNNQTICDQFGIANVINSLKCVSGKCHLRYMLHDHCSNDNDCWGNMHCIGGKCQGIRIGERCGPSPVFDINNDFQDCQWDAYCGSNNICKRRTPDGVQCEPYTSRCERGHFCRVSNSSQAYGVCAKQFTLADGHYCNTNHQCRSGFCDRNSKCKTSKKFLLTSCKSNLDCKHGVNCSVCDKITGSLYCNDTLDSIPCLTEQNNTYSCLLKHKCVAPQIGNDKNTCQMVNCAKEFHKQQLCYCVAEKKSIGRVLLLWNFFNWI